MFNSDASVMLDDGSVNCMPRNNKPSTSTIAAIIPWPLPQQAQSDEPSDIRPTSYLSSNSTILIGVVPIFFTARLTPASCQKNSPVRKPQPRSSAPGTV